MKKKDSKYPPRKPQKPIYVCGGVREGYGVSVKITGEPLLHTIWHRYGKNRRVRVTIERSDYSKYLDQYISNTAIDVMRKWRPWTGGFGSFASNLGRAKK